MVLKAVVRPFARAKGWFREMNESGRGRLGWLRGIFFLAVLYLVGAVFLGMYWSWGPSEFDVKAVTEERLSLLTEKIKPIPAVSLRPR